MVMWWCDVERDDRDECVELHEEWVGAENIPGPSSETESRAHDSSNECSGMIPNETALLPTFDPSLVNNSGVEWDSSWTNVKRKKN